MASRYKALQQQRADLNKQRKDYLSKLDSADATEEDKKGAQAVIDQLKAVDADIAQLEALIESEKAETAASRFSVSDRIEKDPMRGFRDAADFARAVRSASPGPQGGHVDQRLAAIRRTDLAEDRAQAGGVQYGAAPTSYHEESHSAEGFMVPPAMRDEIYKLVFEADDILAAVSPESTESNSVQYLRDESTPWGATGIKAKWAAEASVMTPTKLATAAAQMQVHKLYAFVSATDELLDDAPRLRNRITEGAADAIVWTASEAVVRGTGAGQPLGWENAPCLITQTKEGGQVAATIVAKNLLKMYQRILGGPGARIAWYANRDIVAQLVDLKIGNEPAWMAQNQGLRSAPEGMILGYPVRFSEHSKSLGTVGDIALVNLAGYYAAVKTGGVKFASSIHLFFDYGVEAFRWTFRVGGQPYLSAAVSPAQGSTTKSHFVVLETRS